MKYIFLVILFLFVTQLSAYALPQVPLEKSTIIQSTETLSLHSPFEFFNGPVGNVLFGISIIGFLLLETYFIMQGGFLANMALLIVIPGSLIIFGLLFI